MRCWNAGDSADCANRDGMKFGEKPRVLDLGLISGRWWIHQVDVVAGGIKPTC